MRKCSYCGKEYGDDVERCLIDDEPLSGGSVPPLNVEEIFVEPPPLPVPIPEIAPAISFSAPMLTDRQLRSFELVLVCIIAFATAILTSTHVLLYGYSPSASSGSYYKWISNSLHEIPVLGLLWYVLHRQGKRFADLGLNWRFGDIWRSGVLYLAGSFAFALVHYAILATGVTANDRGAAIDKVGHILFAGGISIATILFQVLNPFFEELIVRAYVMTEIRWLTKSAVSAVIVSTLLQTSYHFYQGVPAAFADGATFLVFSIYYARSGRIAPVILAHFYFDMGGTLFYQLRH